MGAINKDIETKREIMNKFSNGFKMALPQCQRARHNILEKINALLGRLKYVKGSLFIRVFYTNCAEWDFAGSYTYSDFLEWSLPEITIKELMELENLDNLTTYQNKDGQAIDAVAIENAIQQVHKEYRRKELWVEDDIKEIVSLNAKAYDYIRSIHDILKEPWAFIKDIDDTDISIMYAGMSVIRKEEQEEICTIQIINEAPKKIDISNFQDALENEIATKEENGIEKDAMIVVQEIKKRLDECGISQLNKDNDNIRISLNRYSYNRVYQYIACSDEDPCGLNVLCTGYDGKYIIRYGAILVIRNSGQEEICKIINTEPLSKEKRENTDECNYSDKSGIVRKLDSASIKGYIEKKLNSAAVKPIIEQLQNEMGHIEIDCNAFCKLVNECGFACQKGKKDSIYVSFNKGCDLQFYYLGIPLIPVNSTNKDMVRIII